MTSVPGAGAPAASSAATADAMLRGGLYPTLAVTLLATAVGIPAGPPGMAGALLGGVLVAVAMAVGPVLLRGVSSWSPPAVMAAAVGCYLAVVMILGVVYAVLAPASWLDARYLGGAMIAAGLAWSAGQTRAVARLRVLAFGSGGDSS